MAFETTGTLTTLTKSFSNAQKPDLTGLVYTLNGQSISVDVVGSPDTASEETVTQALGGATDYDLSWTDRHTDFRLEFTLSTADDSQTPVVDEATLVETVGYATSTTQATVTFDSFAQATGSATSTTQATLTPSSRSSPAPAYAVTFLPDVTENDITPVDESVEDELTVPNANVADYGDVRYQIRASGSGNAFGSDVVVSQGGADATLTGLPDGEQFDIRARSETEHVTGTYATTTATTLLPAPTVTLQSAGTNSVALTITDNADNEDEIRVERRQEYADGFGPYIEVASLAPDTTSYTDSDVVPGTTYEYRVSNVTEHATSGTTLEVTTTADAPQDTTPRQSGWYVRLTASDGNVRTFTSDGNPERDPSLNDLEEVTLSVSKDESWDDPKWEDADADVWQDGARLPVDTLVEREQLAGETRLLCVGPGVLYESAQYEFSNTDIHAEFAAVCNDAGVPVTVVPPEADNRQLADVDTENDFRDVYQDPNDDTPIAIRSDGSVDVQQTSWVFEGENWGNTSTQTFGDGDRAEFVGFSGTLAEDVVPDLALISQTFTTEREIPSSEVSVQLRYAEWNRGGEVRIKIDGQTVYGNIGLGNSTTSTEWIEALGGLTYENDTAGEEVGPPPTLEPGDHTITIECVPFTDPSQTNPAEGIFAVDLFNVHDKRYAPTFPNSTTAGTNRLAGPQNYPDSIESVFLHNGFLSATGARFEGTFNNLSNTQAIALSNDYGASYDAASNADTLETDFAQPGPDIQLRVTLGGYGSDGTPQQGAFGQTLESYTLGEDIRDSPPLTNDQFSGRYKDILGSLVDRGRALYAVEWSRENQRIELRMSNVADLTSARDLDLVDYQWATRTLGRQVELATIEGGAQTVRAEGVTADTVNENNLDRQTLIAGREQVRAADDGTVYVRGTDYDMNYILGNLIVDAQGNISDGELLEVDYEWKPEGEFAIGGFDDRNQLIETFVGASTDEICQSVAYYLVDRLSDPVISGQATIRDVPPGLSLLEVFAADPVPSDVIDSFYVQNASAREGRVQATIQSRRRTGDVISTVSSALNSVSDRV